MGREPRVRVLGLFTEPTRWPFSLGHSHGMSPAREALGAGSTGERGLCVVRIFHHLFLQGLFFCCFVFVFGNTVVYLYKY